MNGLLFGYAGFMKKIFTTMLLLILVIASILLILRWDKTKPRRDAVRFVHGVYEQLFTANDADVLNKIVLPSSYNTRTDTEKIDFLRKALRDEISEEGLRRIAKEGEFGALLDIFPETGNEWASKAGVGAGDCVAFRLERNGIRSELVVYVGTTPNRMVRANNIK